MEPWKFILLLTGTFLAMSQGSRLQAKGTYFPEDFLTVPQIQPAKFSPEGDALLNLVFKRGNYRLHLYDLESGRNPRIWQLLKDEAVTEIGWAGNDWIVFQVNNGPIWKIDREGNHAVKLYDADSVAFGWLGIYSGNFQTTEILHIPPDENGDLVVSELNPNLGTRLFRINLETGEETDISRHRDLFNFGADYSGRVRFAHTLAGKKKFRILHRWSDDEKWRNLDKLLPDSPNRFQYDPLSIAGRNHILLGFGLDNDLVYLASNAESDRMALYQFNLRTGKMQLLHEDPVYDVFSSDPFISKIRPVFSKKEGTLAGFQYIAEKIESRWLLPSYQTVEEKLGELFPERINLILSADPRDRYFCILSMSSRHPGTLYVYDSLEDNVSPLGELASWIDEEDMASMAPVRFTARDGHPIHGYLTMPHQAATGDGASPPPMVVLVHGGPWIRDVYGFFANVQWLAFNGYSVLQINFRGSSGYGFRHLDMARQRYGTASLEDIIDGVDWAVSEGLADADQVAIMGGSYGGYSAALALALYPDRFRCGIAINGNFDLVAMTRNISRESPLVYRHWKEYVGSVFKKDALRAVSPIELVERMEDPLFVIAGEQDEIVPVEQSRALVEAMKKHGIPHEYREYEGEDHAISSRQNHAHLLESVVRFLEQYLPTDP